MPHVKNAESVLACAAPEVADYYNTERVLQEI